MMHGISVTACSQVYVQLGMAALGVRILVKTMLGSVY